MAAISIAQGWDFKASHEAFGKALPLLFGKYLKPTPLDPTAIGDFGNPDFLRHYDRHLRPRLEEFEARRLAALHTFRKRLFIFLAGVLVIVGGAIAAFSLMLNYFNDGFELLVIPLLLVIGLWVWAARPLARYRRGIKSEIYPLIFKFFGDDFTYRERGPLKIKTLKESGIIPSYDNARTEDYVKGSHRTVALELTEAVLTKRKGSGKNRRTVTVFRGLMILFAAHKPFSGKTIVDRDGGQIGNWLAGKFGGLETVRLEDPVFEKRFEVRSSDQVEARYLLTPSFMERLLALSALFDDANIRCSFYDDRLLLLIPSKQDRFDGISAFRPVTFQQEITTILAEMALIFEIIEVLKLHERTGL